jgi:hypothetical protein
MFLLMQNQSMFMQALILQIQPLKNLDLPFSVSVLHFKMSNECQVPLIFTVAKGVQLILFENVNWFLIDTE